MNKPISSKITVTAILATYNRELYLSQALDSLLKQTRPADEIIVVNDGSTDGTNAVLRGYGERVRSIYQPNSGKPAALNKALLLAQGTHVWLFDDDDLALPQALERHEQFLLSHPDIDFSCGRNYVFDGDGDIHRQNAWRLGSRFEFSQETLLIQLMRQCNLIFQALLVPRQCFAAVGYFDESLLRCEDYDMLLKLARRFRGADIGEMVFVWRNHSGVRGSEGERHRGADRAVLFRKYERLIFSRVWDEFALIEYLPRVTKTKKKEELTPLERFEAQLQRCDIMFRHDLLSQAEFDLRRVVAKICTASQMANVAKVVSRAADIEDPIFVGGARRRAHCLARAICGRARKHLALSGLKGFYWSMHRAIRRGHWRHALTLGSAGVVFAIELVWSNLKRR